MHAKFETSIPMPEEQALANAPVRWKMGRISMATPLFTLQAFNAFDKMVRAIKFEMLTSEGPAEVSLHKAIEISESNEEVSLAEFLKEALYAWNDAYPHTPTPANMAKLICSLSYPADKEKARGVLLDYFAGKGIAIDGIEDDELQLRRALARYAEYNVPVTDLIDITNKLIRINTEVKKKLREEEVQEDSRIKHWPSLLQFSFPKRD